MKRRRSRKCRRCGKEFKTLAGKDYHVENGVCLKAQPEPTAVPAETVAEVPVEPRMEKPFRPRMVVGGGHTMWMRK